MGQFGHFNTSNAWKKYHESSPMRDLRDPDSTGVQWKRNRTVASQEYANQNAISRIAHTVEKLKRRIIGGSGAAGQLNFVGEYDPTRTYSAGQIVIISMGANAGTYAYINAAPSSGNAPYAGGGWWAQFPMGPSGMWL